jgi:hypothetical protein
MTAIVYSGCEPSYSLALKPWPMWGWAFGGSEGDCYWSTTHPFESEPWWVSAPQLIYASMEDSGGGLLASTYFLGLIATLFLIWPLALVGVASGMIRRGARKDRASHSTS